ncbi:RNA polymerase sigma factor [Mesoflavibacter zeaxanthinifaciens]|uniref:RNA polymerase sigma factor n=1 Tax=Mesoflavibacter zeaxanthinifaciens TaxID=393060 RepID=UPI003A8EA834
MSNTDFELLKKGCPSAFADIYAKHSRNIFWVGKRLIDDEFVIESLVQDAFLKLWIHRETIESPKHIFFFLRFVMKRECISYYTRPKNKFSRKIHSLENFENYQDYMAGYDPLYEADIQKLQDMDQKDFDRVKKVLPLLNTESRRFIELCLKYGFQYKAISEAMGTSIKETSNNIKNAIGDIKNIIDQGDKLESKQSAVAMKIQGVMTEQQAEVLKLRCEEKYSFDAIATTLNLSQKEVHSEFMAAYKLSRDEYQQQPQSA